MKKPTSKEQKTNTSTIAKVLKLILRKIPQDKEILSAHEELLLLPTEIKFIDLPPVVSQQLNDIYALSANGTGSFKETRLQMLNYINSHITSSAQVIYVDQSGVNSPGRGNSINPYQSVSYAISQITDSSPSKPYLIRGFGVLTDTDWVINPNIYYDFQNSSYSVSASVTLDPSWSEGGICKISGLFNCTFPDTVNLDFDAISASPESVFWVDGYNIASNTDITINGSTTGATIVILEGINGFAAEDMFIINNCYGAGINSTTGTTVINHTSDSQGGNFNLIRCQQLGDLTVIDNTTTGLTLFNQDGVCVGTKTYRTLNTGIFEIFDRACIDSNPVVLDGPNVGWLPDTITNAPVLLNGATFTPSTIADGVNANFVPTQGYTPSGPSVKQHLQAIAAALGVSSINNFTALWHSPTGNDSTADGSTVLPFQTYDAARLYAIANGASSTTPFVIITVGQYTISSGDYVISPFVHHFGFISNAASFHISSGQVVLDPAFDTTTRPSFIASNIVLNAPAGMALNFSGGQLATLLFNNVSLPASVQVVGSGLHTGTESIAFQNCLQSGSNFQFTNMTSKVINSNAESIVILNDSNISPSSATIANIPTRCSLQFSASGSETILAQVTNTRVDLSLELDGTNLQLAIDSSSYGYVSPTFTNGANFSNITLLSYMEGVNAQNYLPVNFVPANVGNTWALNSLTAYIAGLDNSLGSLSLQKAYNNSGPSPSVTMNNGGISIFNSSFTQIALFGFDNFLMKGHKFLNTISSNIAIQNSLDGVWSISDGLSNYNINFSVGAAINTDAEFYFTNNKTGTQTFNVPAGITFNGIDGSVIGSYTINQPGQTAIIKALNSVNDFSYNILPQSIQPPAASGTFTVVENTTYTSNISSFTLEYSSFITIGSITQVSGYMQFVPTAHNCLFAFDISAFRATNFTSNTQAGGSGTIFKISGSTGLDGSVTAFACLNGTKAIRAPMSVPAANGTDSYYFNFSFQFQNQ